jgi:hypothetical protein
MLIRVWMRTAIRKEITSFGTFLSTLCHEFCHHLDFQRFGFRDSWHTRGFYERTAALYHHSRGTPPKQLFWAPLATYEPRYVAITDRAYGTRRPPDFIHGIVFRSAKSNPPSRLGP